MSMQLSITVPADPVEQEHGHYVAYTDAALTRRVMGPMGGVAAMQAACELMASRGVSDVAYIAATGAEHGEDELRLIAGRRAQLARRRSGRAVLGG